MLFNLYLNNQNIRCLNFKTALLELSNYLASGETEFFIQSNLTGDILNYDTFVVYSNSGYHNYNLSQLLDLIPYFNTFNYIRVDESTIWKNPNS